jgi:hypothetical protein
VASKETIHKIPNLDAYAFDPLLSLSGMSKRLSFAAQVLQASQAKDVPDSLFNGLLKTSL